MSLPELILPTALNAAIAAYPSKYEWAQRLEAQKMVAIIDKNVEDTGSMPTAITDKLNFDMYNTYFWSEGKDSQIAASLLGLINDYHAHSNTIYYKA